MDNTAKYVVMGVTGHTGRRVAEALLQAERKIRVVVRRSEAGAPWRARGAEVAVASLEDEDALARAFQGADGAYVLIPPGYDYPGEDYLDHQRRQADRLSAALHRARPRRTVLLSSVAAHLESGTGPIASTRGAEQALAGLSGLICLRPCFFVENFEAVVGVMADQGVLPTFLGQGPQSMVGAVDIGATAASLLTEAAAPPTHLELAGRDDPTVEAVAEEFGLLLGRSITVQRAPPQAAVQAFVEMGMSPTLGRLYAEMFEGLHEGRIVPEGPVTRGKTPLSELLRAILPDPIGGS